MAAGCTIKKIGLSVAIWCRHGLKTDSWCASVVLCQLMSPDKRLWIGIQACHPGRGEGVRVANLFSFSIPLENSPFNSGSQDDTGVGLKGCRPLCRTTNQGDGLTSVETSALSRLHHWGATNYLSMQWLSRVLHRTLSLEDCEVFPVLMVTLHNLVFLQNWGHWSLYTAHCAAGKSRQKCSCALRSPCTSGALGGHFCTARA